MSTFERVRQGRDGDMLLSDQPFAQLGNRFTECRLERCPREANPVGSSLLQLLIRLSALHPQSGSYHGENDQREQQGGRRRRRLIGANRNSLDGELSCLVKK
ncbi:hypothetical protein [Gemmatimonas sp.]|uniref:hypothetical protein n=1 Tax=Gemmatimonas sp. TaxID=1962908 RepID=UPI003DA522F7